MGNIFWEQLPSNTVKHFHVEKLSKKKRNRLYQSMRNRNVWRDLQFTSGSKMDTQRSSMERGTFNEGRYDSDTDKLQEKKMQFPSNIQTVRLSPIEHVRPNETQKLSSGSNKFKF